MANHQFTPMADNEKKCSICQYNENMHGTCECCPAYDHLVTFKTLKMCPDCYEKEKSLTAELEKPENVAERIRVANEAVEKARAIDNSVETRSDIFNAATVAIVELKAAIEANPEIENKQFALAEELKRRFEHHKSVIFEANQKIIESTNNQKAIQTYLNTLANQLRAEERQKLQLQDLNYKPNPVKTPTPKKTTTTGTRGKSAAKTTEIRKVAAELGVSEFMIATVCIQRGVDPITAGQIVKKSIEDMKAQQG